MLKSFKVVVALLAVNPMLSSARNQFDFSPDKPAKTSHAAKRPFEKVLAELVATCNKYDRDPDGKRASGLSSKYYGLAKELLAVGSKKNAPELLKVYKALKPKATAGPFILEALTRVGDPQLVTHLCVAELEHRKTPSFELYESVGFIARQYVLFSRQPEATAFLLKCLANDRGDEELRCQAYFHVAACGKPEAISAVLKERSKRVSYGALESIRRTFEKVDPNVVKVVETKTIDGVTWGLVKAGPLGNRTDLWLTHKSGNRWVQPLFTGVSLQGVSNWVNPKVQEPTIDGLTGAQLTKSQWWKVLVNNPKLTADSDADGLPDLEEERLGTDPHKADTDGDGVPDGIDLCPNEARPPTTDTDLVLAAAFEARTHFGFPYPALVYADKGMKPFKLPGREGVTMWVADGTSNWSPRLSWGYENGIGLIRLRNPEWNKTHTEAAVNISIYFGGLNGTGYRAIVRKFGNEWIVTSLDMQYIS